MPVNANTSKSWATNPQYLIEFDQDEEIEFFFSLAQQDGRIYRGSKFPFPEHINPVNLMLYPTDDGKATQGFDQKKANPLWISSVVEHKEVSLRTKLKKGKYLIIPSCRNAGEEGEYFLSIYFNTDLLRVSIKHLKKPHVKGFEITEEDEDVELTETKLQIIKARLAEFN